MRNFKNVHHYIFGRDSIQELENVLKEKYQNDNSFSVYLIDIFFKDKDLTKKLPIKQKSDIVVYVDSKDEPHADYINTLVKEIKVQSKRILPAAVIGIGGGTTMDIAKCLSILLTNPGKAEDYQGWDLVKNPAIYKIAIPTISGTGSEVTRTAVLTSKIQKLGINSDYSIYDQIILDPNLMKTVPKDQFVYTAMDCYIHCVESLRGNIIDELSQAFAEKSLELVRDTLLGETNPEKLMVASYFGGLAVANSNVGICHPLSYGLSLVLGYHHGIANCIAFNQLDEYYTKEVKEFRKILKKFDVSLPRYITKRVSQDKIDKMISATLRNEKPLCNAFGENWRDIFTAEKVKQILLRM